MINMIHMTDPTQKFRDKIKQAKESDDINSKKMAGIATIVSSLVGLSQASLIYFAYYVLSTKFPSMIKFNYWEGMVVIFGGFSLLTFIRNHIKSFFTNDKKQL